MSTPRFVPAALGAVFLLAAGTSAQAGGTHPAEPRNPNAGPEVMRPARHDVSAPIRDILHANPPLAQPKGTESEPYEIPNILLKLSGGADKTTLAAGQQRIQDAPNGLPGPVVDLSFEAVSMTTSGCGCLPPDTNGDVSDAHYIQWVNGAWQAFDKTTGIADPETPSPVQGNSFWVGFGGQCETTNDGDPLALWDPQAQRWVMSQFVTNSPFAQCVAVSQTADPFGTYDRYEFNWPIFGDYPKMGVWTDESGSQNAYLLITHDFNSASAFQGASLIALDRTKMLAGDPTAGVVRFAGFDAYGVEPLNLIGTMPAPANACPSFVHFDANTSEYLFWDMCLNWTTPASSTITNTPSRVQGAPFIPYYGPVAQQGTASALAAFGTHIMYRANARAFAADAPTRVSLVVNHTVNGDAEQGGINWVHLNLDNGGTSPATPTALSKTIVDQGTYAPDAENRWMGGIAIDGSGNIGVGYSKSSATSRPQIEITGRTLDDPLGTLRDETNCTEGLANGSQTSNSGRWGDYSSMSVDPVDQCTFYFTSEYHATTSSASWRTRVCSFKFDGCGDPNYALVAQTPNRIEMCGATATTDPSYSLRIGVLNGFTGAVSLTASGVPSGATAQFTPNPVNAPGSSALTIAGGMGLASGEYSMEVEAASGALTRKLALELGISADAPDAMQLIAPTDTAEGVKIRPLLSWGGASNDRIFGDGFDGVPLPPIVTTTDALSYTVEVATDSAFTNIVASATVPTTSWSVDPALLQSTQYYWRVTPHNYCGDGPVSATFSFTTGVPGTCPAGTTATTVFEDAFQSGVNGWVAAGTGATGWTQATAPSGTGMSTTVWRVPNNTTSSDRTLTTPAIAIPSGAVAVFVSYDAYHKSEQDPPSGCWDSSSLEASTDDTTFSYLDSSRLFTDPYNGTASPGAPLAGRKAWCFPGPAGASVPTRSIVDLDSFAGSSLKLRFRMVSDSNTAAPAPNGLIIDNFKVEACQ